ncbi:hypothetical protein ACOKFD_00650 [Flagellimonas sp. S174]|uniref:hypothetical protein n=1 Tax=Flagellimonas sp. S174 TaxID=3410790 RepID=UPI003BF56F85
MTFKYAKPYCCILIQLFSISVWGQNCAEISDWMDVIKKEYPALKVTTYVQRTTIENLAINMYSDKYFVPFRGKSFSSLSEKARTKDWRKIQSCYIKNRHQSIPYKAWVFSNIIYNYQLDFRSNVFTKKVLDRNQLRESLSHELELLSQGQLNYNAVQMLKSNLNSKYIVLFPSEIEMALKKVNKYESISADKVLLEKTETAQVLENTRASLEALLNFENINRELYAKASEQIRAQVNRDIASKTKELVDYLMPKEILKLASTKSTDANAQKINRLIADFKNDYSQVLHIESAQKTFQLFQKRKTEIVSNMKAWLKIGIESVKTQNELTKLAELILPDLVESSPIYKELSNAVNEKSQSLQKKLVLLAEQKRFERKEKEKLFRTEALRRNQEISKLKSEVDILRVKLNNKHSTNLPTYEDLHYILQAHLSLFDAEGKYNRNDGQKFVNNIEEKGFYRISSKNMSRSEFFKDKNGFSVRSYVTKNSDNGNVLLRIENASEDLVNLYQKELLAFYRNRLTTYQTTKYDKYRGAYINSGRTLYNYTVVNGVLSVRAYSNINANTSVKAEQIGAYKLRVTPFSDLTHLNLKSGQKFSLKVSGKMKVGNFLGHSGPEGIKSLSIYNIDKRFLHGSLLGKIGEKGKWFLVGNGGTFTANVSGMLYLKVNDRLVNDNEGFYTVHYEIN